MGPTATTIRWRRFLTWITVGDLLGVASSYGRSDARRPFNLSADLAERSLKKFSEQSGLEIMFSTSVVADVRTRPVVGEMTSAEALRALLAGTPLLAVTDEKTGSIAIRRGDSTGPAKKKKTTKLEERPNACRVAPLAARNHPAKPHFPNPTQHLHHR